MKQLVVGLKKVGATGNFSRRNNLHVTLSFIGETDNVRAAKEAMNKVSFTPFSYKLTSM